MYDIPLGMAYRQITDSTDEAGNHKRKIDRQFTQRVTEVFSMLMHPIHPLLLKVKHVKDLHVLFGLCELAEFNTNKVFLIASRRQDLMKLVSMTSQHLSNSLTRLRAAGIIYGAKGEAIINPNVFWKGSSVERARVLQELSENNLKGVQSDFENEKGSV